MLYMTIYIYTNNLTWIALDINPNFEDLSPISSQTSGLHNLFSIFDKQKHVFCSSIYLFSCDYRYIEKFQKSCRSKWSTATNSSTHQPHMVEPYVCVCHRALVEWSSQSHVGQVTSLYLMATADTHTLLDLNRWDSQ